MTARCLNFFRNVGPLKLKYTDLDNLAWQMEVFLNPLDLFSTVYPDASIKAFLEGVLKEKAKLEG